MLAFPTSNFVMQNGKDKEKFLHSWAVNSIKNGIFYWHLLSFMSQASQKINGVTKSDSEEKNLWKIFSPYQF